MQNSSILAHPRVRDESPRASSPSPGAAQATRASFGMYAAGGILLVGSTVDLLVLWLLQYQNQPQWEFVAVASTLESFPRFALGIAMLSAGLAFRQSVSRAWYLSLGVGMVVLGLVAALLGGIMVTGYFALSSAAQAQPEAISVLQSIALKSVVLSGAFFLFLVPLGILAVRGPKR